MVACARRELFEETGLRAISTRVVAQTINGFAESGAAWLTRFVEVRSALGEPLAREPGKTEAWEWYDWDHPPEPLFPPVASLVESGYRPTT